MRIALATDWFAPRQGGIESQLVGLADGLASRGHEVDVITSTPGASDGAHYRVRSIQSATLPGLDLAFSPALIPELRSLLRDRYDIVHAHISVVSPVGYAAAAVAANLRLPTVISFHSVLHAKQLLLGIANRLLALEDRPVVWAAVSQKVAAQVRTALPAVSVEVLSNGIDLGFWQGARNADAVTHAAEPGAPEMVRFISAMRLHSKKRPRALLRAFAAAIHDTPGSAVLTFVGDGPERDALKRDAVANGIDGAVAFQPWAAPTALRAMYARSDVFTSACEREAFGIAALEARAAGLPVIAMRAAGGSEFLHDGKNALLCDDDISLTAAIRRCIADETLRRLLATAVSTLDQYDWSRVLLAHEAAYEVARTRASAERAAAR